MPIQRKDDYSQYMPLYKAAIKGDWESAKRFLDGDQSAVTAVINEIKETVLHVAVSVGRRNVNTHFVKELLKLIPPSKLPHLNNIWGRTTLHNAAIFGNIEAAKLLVEHNPHLANIHNGGWTPIQFAAAFDQKEMVSYLMTVTIADEYPFPFKEKAGFDLLTSMITSEFYDLALQLVQRYPNLATAPSGGQIALYTLAGKPSAFPSGRQFNCWQRFIYSCVPEKFKNNCNNEPSGEDVEKGENPAESSLVHAQVSSWVAFFTSVCQKLRAVVWEVIGGLAPQIKRIQETKMMHAQTRQLLKCLCPADSTSLGAKADLFKPPFCLATKLGIREIAEAILEAFPATFWHRDDSDGKHYTMFQVAIMNRRENIYNLLNQESRYKYILRNETGTGDNNSLHCAAKLAPLHRLNLVSGAALQMQRELQWYKEVETFVSPAWREKENSDKKTPAVIFTEEHKDLVKEGEKWMKDTATSCSIAAALIVTIAFAAAITVPGGNNSDSGLPIFSKDAGFLIFLVSNALSLFSATASLLMFLSILTARYAEPDFLSALPKRLIAGLVTLFLSITAMMMTFTATLYLVFVVNKKAWILIPVAMCASLPVTLFVSLQFPLLVDMIKSTYGPGIFGKEK